MLRKGRWKVTILMNEELEELRKKKLQEQTKIRQNPFQITKFSRNIDLRTIIQQFSHFSREELVEKDIQAKAAGRILRLRNFGNLIFALLNDQEASIQLMVNKIIFYFNILLHACLYNICKLIGNVKYFIYLFIYFF